jgi:hypothetical protein
MLLEAALLCKSGLLQYTAFLGPAMRLEKAWWDSIAGKYNIVFLDSDFLGPVVRLEMACWDSTARKYNTVFLDSDFLVVESLDFDSQCHLHFHSNTDCRDWWDRSLTLLDASFRCAISEEVEQAIL